MAGLIKQAVIIAGGQGQRLSSVTRGEIPKCMVKVNGKPILEHQIEQLRKYDVKDLVLIVGNLKEHIISYFGDGKSFGVNITYIHEDTPLGTGGSLYYLKGKCDDNFFVVFADTIFSIDLVRMTQFHLSKKSSITLLTHPNCHPYDSDLVEYDKDYRVTHLFKKTEQRPEFLRNNANASFFVFSSKALENINEAVKRDLEKDVVKSRIPFGDVFAYKTSEYIKDAGTPDRLSEVSKDLNEGIVERRNLSNKQKCIFLDRDGTINKANGFISKPEDFVLEDGASEAIKKINESGYLAIVITNQPVVARGECDEKTLNDIHCKMDMLLSKSGSYVDGLYYCPHHPDSGFEGEVKELKVKCDCRKPQIGMFLQAQGDFNIDFGKSYMIGDSIQDVIAGNRAGVHTFLIGESDEDKWLKRGFTKDEIVAKDHCNNLLDAVNKILGYKK